MQYPSTASRLARRASVRCGAGVTRRVRLLAGMVGVAISTLAARAGGAQRVPVDARHTVIGSVRAADESRLVGAHVQLLGTGRGDSGVTAVTEADGTFRFDRVPDGSARLAVRRLGFRPETLSVDVPQLDGGPVVIALERVAQPIAPVVVRESRRAPRLASAFERRRAGGFGHYLTRADIERRNPQRTTDLLRELPGVTLTSSGPRFRAAGRAQSCEPVYFLDGMPLGSGTLDLDALSPKSIEAVEVYSGAATVPAALRTAMAPGGCGAIALWSRQGETPRDPLGTVAAVDSLEDAVARGLAYTADQVEIAAAALPGFGPAPVYPDSLLAAGARGQVVAEFVVDAQGNVDPETIGIVSSTHPLFAAAVRDAVTGARFSPAYRQNRVVRQVVHLPVVFEPSQGQQPTGRPLP